MYKLLLFLLLIQSFLNSAVGDLPPTPDILSNSGEAVIRLRAGWNLVSSPTNESFDTNLIKNTEQKTLWSFSGLKWTSSYGQKIPAGHGFWVKMHSDENISFTKVAGFNPANMEVKAGWNLLGMSADSERASSLLTAFNGVTIWLFKWSKNKKRYEWQEKTRGDRSSLYKGQGFWLKK